MFAAVTEDPHYTETAVGLNSGAEINQGAVMVVVDVAAAGAATEETGFKMRMKLSHVGTKKRF